MSLSKPAYMKYVKVDFSAPRRALDVLVTGNIVVFNNLDGIDIYLLERNGNLKYLGTIPKENCNSGLKLDASLSPNGRYFVLRIENSMVYVYDLKQDFKLIRHYNGSETVSACNLSISNKKVFAGGLSGTMYTWNLNHYDDSKTNNCGEIKISEFKGVSEVVQVLPGTKYLYAVAHNKKAECSYRPYDYKVTGSVVRILDPSTHKSLYTIEDKMEIKSVFEFPEHNCLVTCDVNGAIKVWNLGTMEAETETETILECSEMTHGENLKNAQKIPDTTQILLRYPTELKIVDILSMKCLQTIKINKEREPKEHYPMGVTGNQRILLLVNGRLKMCGKIVPDNIEKSCGKNDPDNIEGGWILV